MSDTLSSLKLSEVEHVKTASRYLRGTIVESLNNRLTGVLNHDDTTSSSSTAPTSKPTATSIPSASARSWSRCFPS